MEYKRVFGICIFFFLLFSVYSLADASEDARTADTINKIMQASKKDIAEDVNRNVDENFKQLDARLMDNQQALFRKAIFALMGSFTVVLFGYAFVMSRISRHYDFNFYEKMMDSKIDKLRSFSTRHIVATGESYYIPVTHSQFAKQYSSSEAYFDKHFPSESSIIEQKDAKIEELQRRIESMGGSVSSGDIYSSVVSPSMPAPPEMPKKASKLKKYLALAGLSVIIVGILIELFLFMKGKGWLDFIPFLKGGK